MHTRLTTRTKVLEACIKRAQMVIDTAADRDLEQVYEAQHRLHGDNRELAVLVPLCRELAGLLGNPAGLVRGLGSPDSHSG